MTVTIRSLNFRPHVVTNPAHGTLSLSQNGSFVYTPTADFSGTDSFTYLASDGLDTSNTAVVTITVNQVNGQPQAFDDQYSVSQNNVLSREASNGVLLNDFDPDGDDLSATVIADAANGTLVLATNGSFEYTPNAGFVGSDSFTYQTSDGSLTSNTATVTIEVTALNSFRVFENASQGTLVGQIQSTNSALDGNLIYQFEDDQLAPQLRLVPDDHRTGSPTSTVVLIEYLDFQCPGCRSYHSVIDQLKDDFAGDLLVVQRHLPLTQVHANAFAAAVAAEAAGRQNKFDAMGDLLFEKQDDWADAQDPRTMFEDYATQLGLNLTQFTSDLDDSTLADRVQRDADAADELQATGTPTFFLQGNKLSELPNSLNEFSNLIQTELDQVDAAFRLNRKTGQLLVRDGAALDFETTTSLNVRIRVSDDNGDSEVIPTEVTIVDVGENPPVSTPDTYTLDEDEVLNVPAATGILSNDSDADGDPLFPRIDQNVTHGTLLFQLNGAFTYTPAPNFSGQDSFVYQISDGQSLSELTTVTITVNPINDSPTVADDQYSVDANSTLTKTVTDGVLSNDLDADGDALSAEIVTNPSHGVASLNPDGSFEYTPMDSFNGIDSFTYRVNDGTTNSESTATVSITVSDVNQSPIAANDQYIVPAGQALSVDAAAGVLANDSDADNDTLIAQVVDQPSHGQLLLGADGTFQYTPATDYTGTDTFTYQANDGVADSNVATVAITVSPPNKFVLAEGSPAGTSVGQIQSLSAEIDSATVFEFVDAAADDRLALRSDDHLAGDPTSSVILIEYLDFQCPTCATFHPIVQQLEDDFAGDLLVVRRHLPLTNIHANAFEAAVAAEAAGRQGTFDAMGDLLFANQGEWAASTSARTFFESYAVDLNLDLTQFRSDLDDSTLTTRVQRDFDDAVTLGASGTPTFFLQGQKLDQLPNSLATFSDEISIGPGRRR